MIFEPQFVFKIECGVKTETRRRVKHDGRAVVPCRYRAGHTYAIQPGRGMKAVGRILVERVLIEPVSLITEASALEEGFDSRADFLAWWQDRYGTTAGLVWRIQFMHLKGDDNGAV